MIKGIYLISILLFMFLQYESKSTLVKENNHHICSRIERYIEEIVDIYNETFLEQYTVYCFNIPPRCTRYREAIREVNKTIFIPKTKTVFECCEGYVKKNGGCSAICPYGCIHGKCIKPKSCMCEEGWQGPDCSIECDDGWYGEECKMYCSCQNGATCDKKNGFCHCPAGFVGRYCESTCPHESFGNQCENVCHCKNGGSCDSTDGACECPPGYIGKYCEKQCEDGSYGKGCMNNCSCNDMATIFCSHIDGKCMCVPGWKGDSCSSKCDLNTWGILCSKKCECPSNAICDHVNGNCTCKPGWQGLLCEEKCTEGYFGKDCKKKCPDCMYVQGNCHHVTGQCSCPAGSRGSNCDIACPENTYGENCIYTCSCNNNAYCDPENGTCTCQAGWIGENCSIPCVSGMYGLNCSSVCNCSDNCTCNPIDGECNCDDFACSGCSLPPPSEIKKAAFDGSESSWDMMIILLVSGVLLGVLLLLFSIICITKKTKKVRSRLRKEETSMTNVIQENSSPSISSFHFFNPNYDTVEAIETLPKKSRNSVSSTKIFPTQKEEKELDLEVEDFRIPACDTASPSGNHGIEILFHGMLTNEEGKVDNCLTEIRVSETAESNDATDKDAVSQTNSIYADVEYKNEDLHRESPNNQPQVKEIED